MMKLSAYVVVLAVIAACCFGEELESVSSLIHDSEEAKGDRSLAEIGRELKRRRRRRRKNRFQATSVETCTKIFNQPISDTLSDCLNEAFVRTQNSINPVTGKEDTCDQHDRETCSATNGCIWRQLGNLPPACHADPCFRINNGRCTIQDTGGRCVWYTRNQNRKRGFPHAGCYISPCNNKVTPGECMAVNDRPNEIYKCEWCGKHGGVTWGCQNRELTSSAQCYNIGDERKCSRCKGPYKENASCRNRQCRNNCCKSPFCTCLLGSEDQRDPLGIGLDIVTSDEVGASG